MKKVMIDTNIYGMMVKDPLLSNIKTALKKKEGIIYGTDIIRKELRDTPKNIKLLNKNLRISLLSIYDEFVKDHTIKIDDKMIRIADKYFLTYRELGGIRSKEVLLNDFEIVAAASLSGMDIVASNDKSTMVGEIPLKAYKIVNSILNLRIPKFWDYEDFKRWLI